MILGSENGSQTVSQVASQSHMFTVSGGKSIDKNISLSYWFVIDYCFFVTQFLMITLFFDPEDHMSYRLTPRIFFLQGWKCDMVKEWETRHKNPEKSEDQGTNITPRWRCRNWIQASFIILSAMNESICGEFNYNSCGLQGQRTKWSLTIE